MKGKIISILTGLMAMGALLECKAAPYTIAARSIHLNGFDLFCDSFNSTDPTRSTGGHYDPAKAGGDAALVAAGQGIFNAANAGNLDIWGYLEAEPSFTLALGPQSIVGSAAWHQAGMTGIEPGHFITNASPAFPDVPAPFGGVTPVGGTINGVTYTYILQDGNYELSTLNLSGNEKVLVLGTAYLLVRGDVKLSGNACIQIEPSARLRIYVQGSANFAGGGVINLGTAANSFEYLGLAQNTSLAFKLSAPLRVLIYAPQADCAISTAGGGVAELESTMVVKTLSLSADLRVHFDEALSP
jgi:hypothetical protein